MNAGTGNDAIAGLERADQLLLFLLPARLRTNPNKIEDDQDEDERDEKIESTARTGWGGRRAAYLSAFGFGVVLLNFVAISYFLTQSHNF